MAKKLKIYNGSSWEDVTFAITPPNTAVTNSFTTNQVIETSTSVAALRITQNGSGEAFRVEDSINPDSSPFVIDASGNVGIGTSTPQQKLAVTGNIYMNGGTGTGISWASDQSSHYLKFDSTLNGIKLQGYSGIVFETLNQQERMRIASDGITTFSNVIYAPNFNSSITTAQSGVNLNTIINSGFYRMNTGQINGPGMDWGQLLVIHGGADTITQIYGDYNSGSLFTRSGNPSDVGGGGSWQPWRQVVDTINGGKLTAAQTTTDARIRNVYTSTSTPSGGLDGDMWAVYV
jgi:hypothetical protein